MSTDDTQEFPSGAMRQRLDDVRFDLISSQGLRRLAETYAYGAQKYADNNWRKGMPFSVLMNHLIAHIYAYLEGDDNEEDHLAHAAWGLFALMEFEEMKPEFNDLWSSGKGKVE